MRALDRAEGVKLQVPPPPTVAVPPMAPSIDIVTVAPASPVPVMAGVAVVIVLPLAGLVMTGAAGPASSVKVSAPFAETLPDVGLAHEHALCAVAGQRELLPVPAV